MTSETTNDQRIILSDKELFFAEMGKVLKSAGFEKSPTKELPDFLVKILALFIKELGGLTGSLGRLVYSNKDKAKGIFDWQYISAEESAIEAAKQLQSMDLIS
jgi:dihydroflavonol-4-reductase